jgi:hypothetical protein
MDWRRSWQFACTDTAWRWCHARDSEQPLGSCLLRGQRAADLLAFRQQVRCAGGKVARSTRNGLACAAFRMPRLPLPQTGGGVSARVPRPQGPDFGKASGRDGAGFTHPHAGWFRGFTFRLVSCRSRTHHRRQIAETPARQNAALDSIPFGNCLYGTFRNAGQPVKPASASL